MSSAAIFASTGKGAFPARQNPQSVGQIKALFVPLLRGASPLRGTWLHTASSTFAFARLSLSRLS